MRRSSPDPKAPIRIEVNVPEFRLRVLEGDSQTLDMAVIVGKPERPTPTLNTRLTHVVFNPPWGVPLTLAKEDLLPQFRAHPQAMMERGFRVFRTWPAPEQEVDPRRVNWRRVTPQRFPYVIRQDPGSENALGQVRLTIPNAHDIFMHDTPNRSLFRREWRALSSGCIRVERPVELTALALRAQPEWTAEEIARNMASSETRTVVARHPIPVRLVYRTAWVDDRGIVHFREDLYGLDETYAERLGQARVLVAAL
jgi:murein L,D-transpeptidase YcbB/YkuD